MVIKKRKSASIGYAASLRSYAKKILEDFGDQEGEIQNEPGDLVDFPTSLRLKKRLDGLSLSIFAITKMLDEVDRHNHKAPAKYKVFIKGECAESLNRAWAEVCNKACSIFNEAADAGIELPSIPAGIGNFRELQSWIEESLSKIVNGNKVTETKPKVAHGFMSVVELAEFHGVDTESLRKRLERCRQSNSLDTELFVESQNRGKNKPKYLYNSQKVAPIIEKLKNKETSDKRPTNKK